MQLFLCSHFSSVGSLIKEEIENIGFRHGDDSERIDENTEL